MRGGDERTRRAPPASCLCICTHGSCKHGRATATSDCVARGNCKATAATQPNRSTTAAHHARITHVREPRCQRHSVHQDRPEETRLGAGDRHADRPEQTRPGLEIRGQCCPRNPKGTAAKGGSTSCCRRTHTGGAQAGNGGRFSLALIGDKPVYLLQTVLSPNLRKHPSMYR